MSTPEEAVELARLAAAERRARGEYPASTTPERAEHLASRAKLMEWAVIQPELSDVRSTRRHGAPLTALKRGLVRLLAQYHSELTAQQTRFNVNLLARVQRLEERIEELERGRPEK